MTTLGFTKDLYFVTSTVLDWMDVFTRPVYKHIIVDSLKHCQANKGFEIYAWVLMTNHMHAIVGTRPDISSCQGSVSDVLRDFKKFTSKNIVKAISTNYHESRREWIIDRCRFRGNNDTKITNFKFWQDGCHVETIHSYDFYKEKLNYIHMNPVREEIVEQPEQYLYSSARDYCGEKGLIDVTLLI